MVRARKDPEERLEWAIRCFEEGHVAAAEQELLALEALGFHCTDLFLYLGHCALDGGKHAAALARYREARRLHPERAEVWLGLGVLAARRLRFGRAVRWLRRAAELQPGFPEVFDNLILCHTALGRHGEAMEAFRRSTSIDAHRPQPYFNAGFAASEMGEPEKARGFWSHVLDIAPGFPDAERMVASCDRRLGRLDAARKKLEEIVRENPRDAMALADLGGVHEDRDEWQTAVPVYARALEVDPAFARVRARLGHLLYRNGRRAEGLDHLRRANGDDPLDPGIAEPLAAALRDEGDPGAALRVFRVLATSCPRDPEAHVVRGAFLEASGRFGRAAAAYRRAHRLDPGAAGPLCGLGRALLRAGRFDRAAGVLEDALRDFPDEPGAYGLLADLALRRGDPLAAAGLLERGLERVPREPGLTVRLAESYLRLGRIPRAIALAARARLCGAVESESVHVLGRAHLALGDAPRAMALAECLLARSPDDPRGLHLRAAVRLAEGNPQAAAPDLRRYVRSRPDDPAGYRDLARCLELAGDAEAARAQARLGDYVAGAG